jgi:hypothetical protein
MDVVLVARALDRLVALSMNNTINGPERCVFLTIEGEPLPEARQIGQELFTEGGTSAMQVVGHTFENLMQAQPWWRHTDSRELDHCWDGVGKWRS